MTKILSLLTSIAALVAISACGASAVALPDRTATHKAARCLKVTVYHFSPAEQKAALRYWTPRRMKSATGFNSASLSGILSALRHPQHAAGSGRSACFRRNVPAAAVPSTPTRG